MRTFVQFALTVSLAAALLVACGGSQQPLGPPGGIPQSNAIALSSSSSYQIIYSFRGSPDGDGPEANLIDVKGVLYGTTEQGGAKRTNAGTVFSVSTGGMEHVIYRFSRPRGKFPVAGLIDVSGTLYGTTMLGGTGTGASGTVFSISTTGQEQQLHSFTGHSDGLRPTASLVDVSGTLYGTTRYGGSYCESSSLGCGTVFSITRGGTEKVLHSFGSGSDGLKPAASLIDVNGTLYGTTELGGTYGGGTVFSVSTSGAEHVLYSFGGTSADGTGPAASLIDVNGTLYGTTLDGGAGPCQGYTRRVGCGAVFTITTSGTEKVLYSFGTRSDYDGEQPSASLTDVNGTFYGTTVFGGTYGEGTIFSVSTSGTEQIVHSFSGSDGRYPGAGMIDVNGTLYGTAGGGPHGSGTVFALTP